jgi:hypothetical protein
MHTKCPNPSAKTRALVTGAHFAQRLPACCLGAAVVHWKAASVYCLLLCLQITSRMFDLDENGDVLVPLVDLANHYNDCPHSGAQCNHAAATAAMITTFHNKTLPSLMCCMRVPMNLLECHLVPDSTTDVTLQCHLCSPGINSSWPCNAAAAAA